MTKEYITISGRLYEVDSELDNGMPREWQPPEVIPQIDYELRQAPEPPKFNLHKAILNKLIPSNSRELNPSFAAEVIGWASTDAAALYLLNLGDIEYSEARLDLTILHVQGTVISSELKSQIVTIIRDIKESLGFTRGGEVVNETP